MGLTVTEDVSVFLVGPGPISVYDSATVTESIGRNLVCKINPMSAATGLQLWSKLESAGDVTSPSAGTGGSEIGSPTYAAAKFNNGILSDVDSEGCKFPTSDNNINLDKGTIEFWAKMKFDETDADYRCLWDFLDTGNGGIYLYFNPGLDDFTAAVYSDGSPVVSITTVGMSWDVDDLIHFAVTWDREGSDIGSSKTIALYIDNVEKASSTTTWNTDTVRPNLTIGVRGNEISWHSDVIFDNLKTYNICKTDFSDKDTETALVAGEGISVSESITPLIPFYLVSVNDTASITDVDAVQVRAFFSPSVYDSLTVTESIVTAGVSYINVNDTITASEYISRMMSLGVSVSDNAVVTEYIKSKLINLIAESETVTISESITMLRSFPGISVYDAITITERIWANMWQERSKETDAWTERTKETDGWLALDGNGYASIADASQTGLDMGTSDFMLEMRVKLTVPTASQLEEYAYFFSKYTAGETFYEAWLSRDDETIGFVILGPVNNAYLWSSSSYVDDLEWHSLIFVVDRDSATGLKLYIDGAEVAYDAQTDPTSVGDLDNTAEFTIGAVATTHVEKLNGQMDEARIWNFGVDGLPADYADYISWRYTHLYAPTSDYNGDSWNTYVTNNLSAYYKLDGDYTDETSNSNDLTAGGSGNSFLSGWVERTKETDEWAERASKEAA